MLTKASCCFGSATSYVRSGRWGGVSWLSLTFTNFIDPNPLCGTQLNRCVSLAAQRELDLLPEVALSA